MKKETRGRSGWVGQSTLGAIALGALSLTVSPNAGAQTEAAAESPPAVEGPAAAEPTEESAALADDSGPAEEPAKAESAPPPEEKSTDGARFRFGVSGGFGPLFIAGYTFLYSGIDLRLGAQINDLVGVYLQPQLGGYWISEASTLGAGGLVGISGGVDFTFADRFFAGAGVGYAVLNNPSGLELNLRVGGYPLMKKYDDRARRKGLMVGLDFRLHFIDGYDAGVAPTFSVGYEAF